MASVTFDRISKRYGATTIVDNLELEVADGELLILLGGSGCGKSTTLRMLAGLETVTEGVIRIGDRDVTRLAPRDRDVAMVFQDYALYPHLTARENIALGLRLRKMPAAEITKRVSWAAEVLGLGPLLDRRPKDMSGGQRQRVAMGRAMVREPAVFLFDEPLSNLDAKLRGQMRIEIGRLQKRLGTTLLYVTHDQVEAMTLGDRLVLLDGGKIQQIGRPMDIYRAPANRFVAGFIGSPPMNFFEGRLEGSGDDLVFVSDAVRVVLPAGRRPSGSKKDGTVTLGIRAEDISLASAGARGPEIKGKLATHERLGASTLLHLDVGDHQLVANVPADIDAAIDDAVSVTLDPSRIHLFAPDGASLLPPDPSPVPSRFPG